MGTVVDQLAAAAGFAQALTKPRHYNAAMSGVTRLLSAIEDGDEKAADRLLPLVYRELRKLAAAKLSKEKPGQTLQPTVLVHEAYLRLVDVEKPQQWNGRGHFFGAAAEAMRRILVERARRKRSQKRGGVIEHTAVEELADGSPNDALDLIALDEALTDTDWKLRSRLARRGTISLRRWTPASHPHSETTRLL